MKLVNVLLPLFLFLFFFITGCGKDPANSGLLEANCVMMADATSPSKKICYENQGGFAIVEGDIILGKVEELESSSARLGLAIVSNGTLRWSNRLVPYLIDPSVSQSERDAIAEAIAHHEEKTGTRFRVRTNEADYVIFIEQGLVCSSAMGMSGGPQHINLTGNCGRGTIIHEIGHALGLMHEHARADRDQFITIIWENIAAPQQPQYYRGPQYEDVGAFDFDSIMLYGSESVPYMTKKDGSLFFRQRDGLSAGDINAIETIYGVRFVEGPTWPDAQAAKALSPTEIQVSVSDRAMDETETVLEYSISPSGPWTAVRLPGTKFQGRQYPIVRDLKPGTAYYFRAQARRGADVSYFSPQIMATTPRIGQAIPSSAATISLATGFNRAG
jgi:hypothetical protein